MPSATTAGRRCSTASRVPCGCRSPSTGWRASARPGTGSLLEEARKKGELRHTQTVMAARKLRDTDGEALVLDFARVEEERHEAVAGLASEVAWKSEEQRRQAEKIKKLEQEKKELEREKQRRSSGWRWSCGRGTRLEDQNYGLRQQLYAAEDGVAQKIKEEGLKAQREFDAHRRDLRCDLEDLEAHRLPAGAEPGPAQAHAAPGRRIEARRRRGAGEGAPQQARETLDAHVMHRLIR